MIFGSQGPGAVIVTIDEPGQPQLTVGPFKDTGFAMAWQGQLKGCLACRGIVRRGLDTSLEIVPATTLCDIDPNEASGGCFVDDLDTYFDLKHQSNYWRLNPTDHDDLILEFCSLVTVERVSRLYT